MFAIIKTGGKQYRVEEGNELRIEKIEGEEGKEVTFKEILLVSDDEGKDTKLGKPFIKGASVKAKILEQGRGKKVAVRKYKSKVRYQRNVGHRQYFTQVKIEAIKA